MPACAPEMYARLSPDEPLSLAYHHESRERERYRALALSFLPIRPDVSRLMATLGIECEQRLGALEALADRMQRRHCLPTPPPRRRVPAEHYRLHLFIRDEAMAAQTLDYALAFAQHSHRFSELVARHCPREELDDLMGQFVDAKHRDCRRLEELCDRLSGVTRDTGSLD